MNRIWFKRKTRFTLDYESLGSNRLGDAWVRTVVTSKVLCIVVLLQGTSMHKHAVALHASAIPHLSPVFGEGLLGLEDTLAIATVFRIILGQFSKSNWLKDVTFLNDIFKVD